MNCTRSNRRYAPVPPIMWGRIEGGTTVNSIAQQASMLYEFRSTAQDCLEEMEEKFRRAVAHWNGSGAVSRRWSCWESSRQRPC
ncbi:peptidase dimerization domain-containing protein [Faecalibacterium prausnitzii]|uniref:peptidase dimerization domain-containing protein n=1 Tax=Faecalibacterium prausnitzii TaxID=853 RepID=UPI003AB0DEEF